MLRQGTYAFDFRVVEDDEEGLDGTRLLHEGVQLFARLHHRLCVWLQGLLQKSFYIGYVLHDVASRVLFPLSQDLLKFASV